MFIAFIFDDLWSVTRIYTFCKSYSFHYSLKEFIIADKIRKKVYPEVEGKLIDSVWLENSNEIQIWLFDTKPDLK